MSKFIVLNNILYQEHHLLVNMLNQNGHVYTLLCIGGQGSAKKQTGKKVELAHIIEVNTLSENAKQQHCYLKEFEVLWNPWKIRNNYSAWCLLNFMLEVALRVLPAKELNTTEWNNLKQETKVSTDYEVLVKLLFFLEEVATQDFERKHAQHLCLFYLAKVMLLQGVFPRISQCYTCNIELNENNVALFQTSHFYCSNCQSEQSRAKTFWAYLKFAKSTKYEELRLLPWNAWLQLEAVSLLDYCEQFFTMLSLTKNNLKSFNSIFD